MVLSHLAQLVCDCHSLGWRCDHAMLSIVQTSVQEAVCGTCDCVSVRQSVRVRVCMGVWWEQAKWEISVAVHTQIDEME